MTFSPFLVRTMASISERTFIAIKPDGVQRGLVGEIIKRFEQKGFKLVAMKLVHASEDLLREHYIDLKDRPFYDGLVQYMHSGPVVAMERNCAEGENFQQVLHESDRKIRHKRCLAMRNTWMVICATMDSIV
ncbi:nucleoside diphosphate kinase isoform X4 [Egretta garzetta]|uniref:nucleoside diphosphate kinase isoform X4 n=1 Tax=Egretta garzetta TaxID=188379 RepID=UPI00163C795B|nr:nucleoside diphosphate kinase isoform X4 [Egretta garzetta]